MKISRERKKVKGFTLVELVIVIAIVIVLSVVSVPIYRNYVDKAKVTEAYALLGTIMSAQKAYYSEYGNFLYYASSSAGSNMYTANETVLGIDARANKYFTYFGVGNMSRAGSKTNFVAYVVPHGGEYSFDGDESHTTLELRYNITSGSKFTAKAGLTLYS